MSRKRKEENTLEQVIFLDTPLGITEDRELLAEAETKQGGNISYVPNSGFFWLVNIILANLGNYKQDAEQSPLKSLRRLQNKNTKVQIREGEIKITQKAKSATYTVLFDDLKKLEDLSTGNQTNLIKVLTYLLSKVSLNAIRTGAIIERYATYKELEDVGIFSKGQAVRCITGENGIRGKLGRFTPTFRIERPRKNPLEYDRNLLGDIEATDEGIVFSIAITERNKDFYTYLYMFASNFPKRFYKYPKIPFLLVRYLCSYVRTHIKETARTGELDIPLQDLLLNTGLPSPDEASNFASQTVNKLNEAISYINNKGKDFNIEPIEKQEGTPYKKMILGRSIHLTVGADFQRMAGNIEDKRGDAIEEARKRKHAKKDMKNNAKTLQKI